MARLIGMGVRFDADAAIRDPLFWLGLLLDKVTFGRVDTGRWRRYVTVEPAEE